MDFVQNRKTELNFRQLRFYQNLFFNSFRGDEVDAGFHEIGSYNVADLYRRRDVDLVYDLHRLEEFRLRYRFRGTDREQLVGFGLYPDRRGEGAGRVRELVLR